jgi:DNA-binding beta-propeller fold protein YncE
VANKRRLAVLGAAASFVVAAAQADAASFGRLPGSRSIKVCAAAGSFWPTMTLALSGSFAWVACKEQSRVQRVNTTTGKVVKVTRLSGPVVAVAAGLGSVWALDADGTLYRINPATAKVTKRIPVLARAAYNIWIGGGSVWVADDQGAEVIRVSPKTNKVVARVPVGDGPADMVFDSASAWVINHRDRVLFRIDLKTNAGSKLTTVPGDAPERMVLAGGKLWLTGRGTDLLRLSPSTGALESTIEIGASGIDLAVLGDDLWVPVRSAAVDASGFPTMEALKRVSIASGAVSTVSQAVGRLDVHGLAARAGKVWLADNTSGFLYSVSAG